MRWYIVMPLLLVFATGCGGINKILSGTPEEPKEVTEVNESVRLQMNIDNCREEVKSWQTLYNTLNEVNRTQVIYRNVTVNHTVYLNQSLNISNSTTCVLNFNYEGNDSFIFRLIRQVRYYENLSESYIIYDESTRNRHLIGNLSQCEDRLEDIQDVFND